MSVLLLTLVSSALFCGSYLELAKRWQILDHPTERSSHELPTPHGGGVPLFLAFFLGLFAAAAFVEPWQDAYLWLSVGALALVALGVLDDLYHLPVTLRLCAYLLCCIAASCLLLGAQPWAGWLVLSLVSLALLWCLNLYNFMDGIDGLAATQCFLCCCSAALLSWFSTADVQYSLFCLLLAAAHAGFLIWNWPPARLFMGDAGSIPTGFLLGTLALLGAVGGQLSPVAWLILLAAFVTDASVTLLRRMATGQSFTRPHRTHAYQRLSRHWGGHLPVDLVLIALNALWLFPLAWASTLWPERALILVILAYLPLLAGMAKVRNFG